MTSTRTINLPSTTPIRFASFLASNGAEFYRQVTAFLGEITGWPTEFVAGLSAEVQDRQVDEGQIGGVFTWGLPYTRKADARPPRLFLLAAPVMAEPHNEARPVYFSDIINDWPHAHATGCGFQRLGCLFTPSFHRGIVSHAHPACRPGSGSPGRDAMFRAGG